MPRETEHNDDAAFDDPINHPRHYTSGRIEVIEFIEDQKLPFHLSTALKYICRAGKKDPTKTTEDLEKAVWYIKRYIRLLEKEAVNSDRTGNTEDAKTVEAVSDNPTSVEYEHQ